MHDKFISQLESDTLMELFDGSFIDVYRYAIINLVAKMSTLECNYIVQAYTVLEGLLQSAEKEENQSLPKRYLEHLYIFSIMWSVGALYELDDRAKLEAFMREKTDLDLPSCDPSSGDTIFEFFVDGKGEWRHWSTKVEEYLYPKDSIPVYATILVPNVDNVRTDFLIHTVAKQEKVCTPTTTPTTTSIATPIIMLVFTSTTTPTATPTTTTHCYTHYHNPLPHPQPHPYSTTTGRTVDR